MKEQKAYRKNQAARTSVNCSEGRFATSLRLQFFTDYNDGMSSN